MQAAGRRAEGGRGQPVVVITNGTGGYTGLQAQVTRP